MPAPGGVQVEVAGVEVGDDVPADHRNLAFIAAEKLMVRAGRSGHGVRLVLRKHIPAGGGLGGGSADAAAALLAVRELLDVDVDDAGVLALAAEVGFRRAVLRAGRRGVDARARRDHRAGVGAHRARVPGGDPAVPAVDARRLPGVGQARRPAVGPRGARAAPARAVIGELVNDLEPAAEALEPRLRRVPRRARGRDRRARAARGERLGLRGAGRRRPRRCRRSSTQVGRRAARARRRHDERQPRRPPRQLTPSFGAVTPWHARRCDAKARRRA